MTLLVIACGGGGSTTTPPPVSTRTLSKVGGDNQTAIAGALVAVPPSVKITDENSQPVSGVSITFSIGSGGGSITGESTTTGANGTAAVGSWTMGPAAGAKTLTATATAAGVIGGPVSFTATATAPPLSDFSPTSNTSLSAGSYN